VGNVRFNQPGNYTMRHVFTVAGCADTAVAMLRVVSPPVVELGPDAAICPGDTLVLETIEYPGATYEWNTGLQETSIGIDQPGFYSLTVTQSGTCTASDGIEVHLLNVGDIDLGPDTFLCPGATLRLSAPAASAVYTLNWSTGNTGGTLDVDAPGFYSLEMDAGNCFFLDTIIVRAADCDACEVYAPSVFMPESTNGGYMFQLFPGCPFLSGNWRIYDRWGELLFESNDLSQAWDGRLNGKKMPSGVYLYDAILQLAPVQQPAEWRRMSGNFTLIR
jgi:gliding motility-associated-like protein